jgi:hypothetical protein
VPHSRVSANVIHHDWTPVFCAQLSLHGTAIFDEQRMESIGQHDSARHGIKKACAIQVRQIADMVGIWRCIACGPGDGLLSWLPYNFSLIRTSPSYSLLYRVAPLMSCRPRNRPFPMQPRYPATPRSAPETELEFSGSPGEPPPSIVSRGHLEPTAYARIHLNFVP